MPVYTKFKSVDEISDPVLSDQLTINLITFLNWGFLEAGAFSNVTVPTSGAYGGDFHKLQPVKNPYYTNGQVWQGVHDEWVFESGLERSDQPINISGVFVDNTFYPVSTTGTYEYHINYPNGQVVFENAISTSSEVKLEYSFKNISVLDADTLPFFTRVQSNMHRPDHMQYAQFGSGDWDMMRETSVGLPCVGIDISSSTSAPYSIGGSNKYARPKVNFHVFAETKQWANKLAQVIDSQEFKSIYLFDLERMIDDEKFILDYRGTVTSGTMMYPDLVKPSGEGGYRWETMRFIDSNLNYSKKIHQNLHHASVDMELEVVVSNI